MTHAEVATLLGIVRDFHWQARRDCEGRSTYATKLFNDHTRWLLAHGRRLNPTGDATVWACDAMGRAYDGLSEAEATPGTPEARGGRLPEED